jgi:hypothetical protein
MRPSKRYELVELVITVAQLGQTKFPFQDIPQLRSDVTKDIIVRALETYTVDSITTDFNGVIPITAVDLEKAFLTLYVEGEESTFRLPLVKLHNVWTNAVPQPPATWELNQFENLQIDWTKSYISTGVPFASVTQFSILLGVTYQRLKPGTMNKLRQAAGQSSCAVPGDISMM